MNTHYRRKKYLIFLLILPFCLPFNTIAQGFNTTNWKFSNPKQFGFTVLDVDYFDNSNVIAVGSDGGIAKSVDGGSNWSYGVFTYLTAGGLQTKAPFNDIHYITANVAYAVGDRGSMAKTTDGGVTWNFVNTPLFNDARNINAVWFINNNTGYIGGDWNSVDSIPKLYVTNNGGATWDSIAAPVGGKTRIGYINNANIPASLVDITGKGKTIYRIEFTSPTQGYVVGSGQTHFPAYPAVNATTCLPTGANTSTSANNAALIWRYNNGVLTDYSLSKERLGYSGINTNTVACNTQYNAAQIAPVVQTYRAMNIINDSMIVVMSFNNNTVVRVSTGVNDNTVNLATGLSERGKYQVMNYPFPPSGGPQAGPPIPNPQVLLASNPYQIKRATNGKLFAPGNFGRLWTSTDTGRNWKEERTYPVGQNYSAFAAWALDIAPNGKFLFMGSNGAVADSVAGVFNSNYKIVAPGGGYAEIEFADCNTGIAAGGAFITTTADGGATWTDRFRADFQALNITITAVAFPSVNKSYFTTNGGALYRSPDRGVTMDPIFSNGNYQFQDVMAIGPDTVWVVGSSAFSVAAASRTSAVFRSINNGVTWQTIGGFPVGTTAPALSKIFFPSRQVGFVAGSQGAIYKTIDGGLTWTDISPFPATLPRISYTEVYAVDNNTVFACGNGFPRKVVYKSVDGGTTWTDITSNILTIFPVGNLNGILFHDANNGYVCSPGGALLKTTNGGTSWTLDIPPSGVIFETMAFAPRSVPAGISFANRKMFVTGFGIQGTGIMEYGNPANIAVNATETVTNATCTNLTAGSITINATGAIAPYSYSINGGPFQTSNTFTGLTQGPKTITIKDSYCGTLTKTVTVGFTDNLTLSTNNDTLVCAGAPVQLVATSPATTYSWAPATGLTNPNISNPVTTINSAVTYTVTAGLNGCVRTRNVTVNIKPNPQINAGPDKTIVAGDAVTLDGFFPVGIPQSITWAPAGTLTGANTLTPVARPLTTTTYTLTIIDNNSCTATDAATINVIPYCVKVMEAFTPNGDAKNDLWLVTNGAPCAGQIKVAVYNRYGGLVYKNDNYQNNWDGTYNGKPVADGTYYYNISYRLINGNPVIMKGDVTILR
jgi:gliding motility-associated-like protein